MKAACLLFACQVLLASLVTSEMFDLEKLLKSMDSQKSSPGHRDEDPIPRVLLDEFSTYVDRLMSREESNDQSDLNREMNYDYKELRKAMSNDDQEREEYKLKPGQVPPLACGRTPYKCCPDNSPAPKSGKAGCALRLCYDVHIDTCNAMLESGQLDCEKMWKTCPYSCKRCKLPAAPIKECEANNPGAFCCWDGTRGYGAEGKQCSPCQDHYTRLCPIFKNVSRGCRSNSWRIRTFMQKHCARSCELCSTA